MRFSAIALMAEKACYQIENIVDIESNEEIASSKDELIQAVIISLYSLSSQFCSNLASGRLGSYSVAFRSPWPEAAVPVFWVKSGFILLAVLYKVSREVIGSPEEHYPRPKIIVSLISFSILTTP
jgi:hypothetical protein